MSGGAPEEEAPLPAPAEVFFQSVDLGYSVAQERCGGVTHLWVRRPADGRHLVLNARGALRITSVEVNGQSCAFEHADPLREIVREATYRDAITFQLFHRAALYTAQAGELRITLPPKKAAQVPLPGAAGPEACVQEKLGLASVRKALSSAGDASVVVGGGSSSLLLSSELLFVRVDFRKSASGQGLRFLPPCPRHSGICYTTNDCEAQVMDNASALFPTVTDPQNSFPLRLSVRAPRDHLVLSSLLPTCESAGHGALSADAANLSFARGPDFRASFHFKPFYADVNRVAFAGGAFVAHAHPGDSVTTHYYVPLGVSQVALGALKANGASRASAVAAAKASNRASGGSAPSDALLARVYAWAGVSLDAAQRLSRKLRLDLGWPCPSLEDADPLQKHTLKYREARAACKAAARRAQVYLPVSGGLCALSFGGLSLLSEDMIPDAFAAPYEAFRSTMEEEGPQEILCASLRRAQVATELVQTLACDLLLAANLRFGSVGEAWMLSAISGHLATVWLSETAGTPPPPPAEGDPSPEGDPPEPLEEEESDEEDLFEDDVDDGAFAEEPKLLRSRGELLARRRLRRLSDLVLSAEREGHCPPLCPPPDGLLDALHPHFRWLRAAKGPFVMHMVEARSSRRAFFLAVTKLLKASQMAMQPSAMEPSLKKRPKKRRMRLLISSKGRAGGGAPRERRAAVPLCESQSFLESVASFESESWHDIGQETSFLDAWVRGSGVAYLRCGYSFERRTRDHKANVVVEQVRPPWAKGYSGNLLLRVVERDGTWDHLRSIGPLRQAFSLPVHCKEKARPSRPRRPEGTGPRTPLSDAAREALEELREMVPNFGADDEESPALGIAEALSTGAVRSFQVDPQMHLLRDCVLRLPEPMLVCQLFLDEDLDCRVAAARALVDCPQPRTRAAERRFGLLGIVALSDVVRGVSEDRNARHSECHRATLREEACLALGRWQLSHAPLAANTPVSVRNWPALEMLLRCWRERWMGVIPARIGERPRRRDPPRRAREAAAGAAAGAGTGPGTHPGTAPRTGPGSGPGTGAAGGTPGRTPTRNARPPATHFDPAGGLPASVREWVPMPAALHSETDRAVRSALCTALSLCRARDGYTPPLVFHVLLSALLHYDGARAAADDASELCALISAMAHCRLHAEAHQRRALYRAAIREAKEHLRWDIAVRRTPGRKLAAVCVCAISEWELMLGGAPEELPYADMASGTFGLRDAKGARGAKRRKVSAAAAPAAAGDDAFAIDIRDCFFVRLAAAEAVVRHYIAEDSRWRPSEAPAGGAARHVLGTGVCAAVDFCLSAAEAEASRPSCDAELCGAVVRLAFDLVRNALMGDGAPHAGAPRAAASAMRWPLRSFLGGLDAGRVCAGEACLRTRAQRKGAASAVKGLKALNGIGLFEGELETKAVALRLVERMWLFCNRAPSCVHDQRLRCAAMLLYREIWGRKQPSRLEQQARPRLWLGEYVALARAIKEEREATPSLRYIDESGPRADSEGPKEAEGLYAYEGWRDWVGWWRGVRRRCYYKEVEKSQSRMVILSEEDAAKNPEMLKPQHLAGAALVARSNAMQRSMGGVKVRIKP